LPSAPLGAVRTSDQRRRPQLKPLLSARFGFVSS
jgi:hypothetical protein